MGVDPNRKLLAQVFSELKITYEKNVCLTHSLPFQFQFHFIWSNISNAKSKKWSGLNRRSLCFVTRFRPPVHGQRGTGRSALSPASASTVVILRDAIQSEVLLFTVLSPTRELFWKEKKRVWLTAGSRPAGSPCSPGRHPSTDSLAVLLICSTF